MTLIQYAQMGMDRNRGQLGLPSTPSGCWTCGREFAALDFRHFPHSSGWQVEGFHENQWLYFQCPDRRCNYETSFDKLGISRPLPQGPSTTVH